MKHEIAKLLQLIFRLPRPNMIWGNKVENNWNLMTAYLYIRYIFNAGSGQVYGVWNIVQSSLLLYVAFSNKTLAVVVAVCGVLSFFVIGHILVIIGFQKKEANLANSQNPDLMEIKADVKKILQKLENPRDIIKP